MPSLALNTKRSTSSTCGVRTFASILVSGAYSGAGGTRRMYAWQVNNNKNNINDAYAQLFSIQYAQFKSRKNLFYNVNQYASPSNTYGNNTSNSYVT